MSDLKPRGQHYIFAHRAIPQWAFKHPNDFVSILMSERGQDFLIDLWNLVGQNMDGEDLVAYEGLEYSIEWGAQETGFVVVTMPPPKRMPEAHFIAVVFQPSEDPEASISVRTLTLEKSISFDTEEARTALCEWRFSGDDERPIHANFGDGPEPKKDEFLKAVVNCLSS